MSTPSHTRLTGVWLLIIVLCFTAGLDASAQGVVVFTNANVIDGVTERVVEGATVMVRDGQIESIETGAAAIPDGAEVIDVEGRYLLPGYIDAHMHIASIEAAKRALASGVTTARSASTGAFQDVALRELVRAGGLAGPEILAAGTFVTPDLGNRMLADERLVELHEGVATEAALRHLVRVNLDRGADVIKSRATERAGLPDTDPRKQVYTEEQLRIIVEEAAKDGVSVMVHAHGDEGARAAVRAGVRSIEHGTYLSDETLALMKAEGTYLVPTYTIVLDLIEPGGEYDNATLRIRGQHMQPNLAEAVRKAHALGVPIAASTDSGYGSESLARVGTEMTHFVDLGMTPFEALQTATTVAADLLEVADRTGRIAPGYEADLVVVNDNPLRDIRVVQDVLLVMSNGRIGMNRLPFGK